MQITKDIVRDLLPVYLSGEASADTRVAVEAYLAEDAMLRVIVDAAGVDLLPRVDLPPGLEAQSLERTRRLLARKNFWLGFALVFSFLPLTFGFPLLADLGILIGLGGWAAFLFVCKQLSATGLEAPRGWIIRILWACIGVLVGIAAGRQVEQQTGWHAARYFLPLVCYSSSLWIGQKLRQIATPEALTRPTTLLGK